jgi:hypothetical protein
MRNPQVVVEVFPRKRAQIRDSGLGRLTGAVDPTSVARSRIPTGKLAHPSCTRVSNPDEGEVGELNRVEVRDNGEGSNAPPDQVSTIPANPGDADATTCVDPPTNTTIRTVQRGDVQVRG